MNIFSIDRFKSDALAHALYRCYDRPGSTVGIIFDKISRKIDFLHEVSLCIHQGELSGVNILSEYRLDENDTVIQFQNGSKIKVIFVSALR